MYTVLVFNVSKLTLICKTLCKWVDCWILKQLFFIHSKAVMCVCVCMFSLVFFPLIIGEKQIILLCVGV